MNFKDFEWWGGEDVPSVKSRFLREMAKRKRQTARAASRAVLSPVLYEKNGVDGHWGAISFGIPRTRGKFVDDAGWKEHPKIRLCGVNFEKSEFFEYVDSIEILALDMTTFVKSSFGLLPTGSLPIADGCHDELN